MSTWYYIGPDKTGFDCSDCCAGFSSVGGSCVPVPCSVVGSRGTRNYVCPSDSFPSPFHYYYRNPATGNVTVSVNPKKCLSGISPDCGFFDPPLNTLNSGGRAGSGCSQTWPVFFSGSCQSSSSSCSISCREDCGEVLTGFITYNKICSISSGGSCSCVSGPTSNSCSCECVDPRFGSLCCDPDPFSTDCPCGSTDCITCDDGTIVCFGQPCPCDSSPIPVCAECERLQCNETSYSCVSITSCESECSAGYICSLSGPSCGQCVCNTQSTCCVGESFGWSYSSGWAPFFCRSCGYDPTGSYPTSSDGCCRAVQKGCSNATQKCCADGLCYSSSTTICRVT